MFDLGWLTMICLFFPYFEFPGRFLLFEAQRIFPLSLELYTL